MKFRLFETIKETGRDAINTGITCSMYATMVAIAIKLYTQEEGCYSVLSTAVEYGLKGAALGVAQKGYKALQNRVSIGGIKPDDEEYNAVFALFVGYHLWEPIVKPIINTISESMTPDISCSI